MRLRIGVDTWAVQFFALMGLVPLGCGGSTDTDEEFGTGGAGGAAASGGTSSSGGTSGSGGSAGTMPGSGGTAGTGGTASTGGVWGIGSGGFPCDNPTPYGGPDSGFVMCEDGVIYRPVIRTCTSTLPRSQMIGNGSGFYKCSFDADCTAAPHGYCKDYGPANTPASDCRYGCVQDSDCQADEICFCGDPVGRCVAANCSVNADCESARCALSSTFDRCLPLKFACIVPEDECVSDTECGGAAMCHPGQGGFRSCVFHCSVGRPFLVEDAPRLAPAAHSAAWLGDIEEELEVELGLFTADQRRRLADGWTQIGLMEHASIAAFARFALELMSFGAPSELLQEAQVAMADELRHARIAFELATAFGDRPISPGLLDMSGSLLSGTLAEAVATAVREGCIGETAAAIEAAEAAAVAECPVLTRLMTRIAEDERRHAALAWKFVRWAISTGDDGVGQAVRGVLIEEGTAMPLRQDPGVPSGGILSSSARAEIRRQALRHVVHPGLEALLARPGCERTGAVASG